MTTVLTIRADPQSVFAPLSATSTELLALVRPNNPPPGVAGFLFDIEEDETTELASDITDHFVEDNTAFQDQIALRPVELEVNGCVAELVYQAANGLSSVTAKNQGDGGLADNPDVAPGLTPGATSAYALQQAVDTSATLGLTQTNSLAGFFGQSSPQPPLVTRQSNAFLYFYNLWLARVLFTVETPWGIWENMAILQVSANQSKETKYRSDFRVRFKQISIASTPTVSLGTLAGRAAGNAAASTPTQNGQLSNTPIGDPTVLIPSSFAGPEI